MKKNQVSFIGYQNPGYNLWALQLASKEIVLKKAIKFFVKFTQNNHLAMRNQFVQWIVLFKILQIIRYQNLRENRNKVKYYSGTIKDFEALYVI